MLDRTVSYGFPAFCSIEELRERMDDVYKRQAEEVIARVTEVKEKAGDRALLRALHFFEENKRVEKEVCALKEDRFEDFLELITESGNSSWKWLQNCYVPGSEEQGITTALALTELFLKEKGCGACRVHGGGFAGVIMAMIPNALADEYIAVSYTHLAAS